MDDSKLVYSTDPKLNQKCPKCKELVPECRCKPKVSSNFPFTAVLRIEKAGRMGKTVTVVDHLPRSKKFLEALAHTLKTKCGSGGTYLIGESGKIEIQGDKREMIRSILQKERISFKG